MTSDKEAMVEATRMVNALLPLESNDKLPVDNIFLSKTRKAMMIQKKSSTLPASTGAPEVVQDMCIGEGTNLRERPTRNDELRTKPSGSLRSEKRRKYSKAQRAKRKKKLKSITDG